MKYDKLKLSADAQAFAAFAAWIAISATFCAAWLSGADGQLTTKLSLGKDALLLIVRNRPGAVTLPRIAGGITAMPSPSSAMRTTVASDALAWMVARRPARSNRSRTAI